MLIATLVQAVAASVLLPASAALAQMELLVDLVVDGGNNYNWQRVALPGMVVVDPFCGSGSIPLAARRMGCVAVAGDNLSCFDHNDIVRSLSVPLTTDTLFRIVHSSRHATRGHVTRSRPAKARRRAPRGFARWPRARGSKSAGRNTPK